jgi:hypothetical protein
MRAERREPTGPRTPVTGSQWSFRLHEDGAPDTLMRCKGLYRELVMREMNRLSSKPPDQPAAAAPDRPPILGGADAMIDEEGRCIIAMIAVLLFAAITGYGAL